MASFTLSITLILIKEEINYNLLYEKERTTKTNHKGFSS